MAMNTYGEEDTAAGQAPEAEHRAGGEPATDDSVAVYLRDIGAIPLLTASEEVSLARAMELGRQADQQLASPTSPEECLAALKDKEEGEQARRRMIESNLRLVVSIARRYSGRGMPLSDLIEEGNLGLMRATEKFDYKRGYRFSTYATWWIRQAVTRSLANQSRVVRLPVHVSELINNVSRASHRLSQDLGRDPTSAEIAAEVQSTPERVREVLKAAQQPISLEQPFGDDGEGIVSESVEDTSIDSPAEQIVRDMMRRQVRSAVGGLSDREQKVLALRYGLATDRYHTLEEVGTTLGLTRERIRQIEKEALWKLRTMNASDNLKAYLG